MRCREWRIGRVPEFVGFIVSTAWRIMTSDRTVVKVSEIKMTKSECIGLRHRCWLDLRYLYNSFIRCHNPPRSSHEESNKGCRPRDTRWSMACGERRLSSLRCRTLVSNGTAWDCTIMSPHQYRWKQGCVISWISVVEADGG